MNINFMVSHHLRKNLFIIQINRITINIFLNSFAVWDLPIFEIAQYKIIMTQLSERAQ